MSYFKTLPIILHTFMQTERQRIKRFLFKTKRNNDQLTRICPSSLPSTLDSELHTSRLAQFRKRKPHEVRSRLCAGHFFGFWRPVHRSAKLISRPARATGTNCNAAASCKKFCTYTFPTQKELTIRNIQACIYFINTLYVELVCVHIFSVEHITCGFSEI